MNSIESDNNGIVRAFRWSRRFCLKILRLEIIEMELYVINMIDDSYGTRITGG